MYRCMECGRLLEDTEVDRAKVYRGIWCGRPAYEEVAACPYCGGAAQTETSAQRFG